MIVSREHIQQLAESAALAGQCPHAACPYPEHSEAARAFHEAHAEATHAAQLEGGAV